MATYRWLEPIPPEPETLGQEFKRIRKYLGLSQVAAAEICGVSEQTVSHWETGKRQFNHPDQTVLIRQALAKLKRRRDWRERKR